MKLKFKYEDKEIEFDITRRKRKTICIKIEEGGKVVVSAPLRVSKDYILLVVKNRASWILEKQKEIQKRSSKKIKRDFTKGSTFMYLGKEYPIDLIFEEGRKKISVEFSRDLSNKCNTNGGLTNNIHANITNGYEGSHFEANKFIIRTNNMKIEDLRLALEKWYRAETLRIVTERINYYADNFKDKVTNIKVKEQKRRWASCTGKNAILFNWRISMARPDVLDYVVVHEMCHMDHRNHSKYFWNRVAEIMPDYREKHEWLRLNGMNLSI